MQVYISTPIHRYPHAEEDESIEYNDGTPTDFIDNWSEENWTQASRDVR